MEIGASPRVIARSPKSMTPSEYGSRRSVNARRLYVIKRWRVSRHGGSEPTAKGMRRCLAKRLCFPPQLLSTLPSRHLPATLPTAGYARRRSRSSRNKFGEADRRLHSRSRRSFITSRHLARCKTPRAKPSQTPMLRSNARGKPLLAAKSQKGLAQILGFCDGHQTRELARFTSSDSP
jgi:hypothetical protein